MRYAAKKNATQYDERGHLKCDRCGKVVDPWPLSRPDNCGLSVTTCMRSYEPVLAGWERERVKQEAA